MKDRGKTPTLQRRGRRPRKIKGKVRQKAYQNLSQVRSSASASASEKKTKAAATFVKDPRVPTSLSSASAKKKKRKKKKKEEETKFVKDRGKVLRRGAWTVAKSSFVARRRKASRSHLRSFLDSACSRSSSSPRHQWRELDWRGTGEDVILTAGSCRSSPEKNETDRSATVSPSLAMAKKRMVSAMVIRNRGLCEAARGRERWNDGSSGQNGKLKSVAWRSEVETPTQQGRDDTWWREMSARRGIRRHGGAVDICGGYGM